MKDRILTAIISESIASVLITQADYTRRLFTINVDALNEQLSITLASGLTMTEECFSSLKNCLHDICNEYPVIIQPIIEEDDFGYDGCIQIVMAFNLDKIKKKFNTLYKLEL